MADIPVVQAEGIRKSFAGVEVLHGVDLDARAGSVLALLGENGAGKSTLVKILAGDHAPTEGTIRIDGEQLDSLTPTGARDRGVRMIFQELMDAPTLTVAENVSLGDWPKRGPFVDWSAVRARAVKALSDLGADIDPDRRLETLRIGERQIVEIARAMLGRARCLILDEPTAALSADEAERLFGYIGRLREQGVAIIYITHRLDEVQRIADRVHVLRDGLTAASGPVAEFDREGLVTAMVGRAVVEIGQDRTGEPLQGTAPLTLRLSGGSADRAFEDVSLDLRAGKVLALYGKVGSGIGEVAEALYGMRPLTAGTIEVDGDPVAIRGPVQAIRSGIGLLPGDRQREGAFMNRSVAENLAAPSWGGLARRGLLTRTVESTAYRRWHDRLGIRSRNDPAQPFMTLSGGNQQKVLLGRWLEHAVRVLLLIEPTRGVDVGARQEIYRAVLDLTRDGVAVLVASSDHDEVLQLADSVAVMVRGRLTQELPRAGLTANGLVTAAGEQVA